MSSGDHSTALKQVIAFYESLTPDSLVSLTERYDENAHFIDPFNDVHGVDSICAIFAEMFENLDSPRFVVLTAFDACSNTRKTEPNQAFLTWDFHFRRKGEKSEKSVRIHGSTHLVFGNDSRIVIHRDYWDAAGQLYEQIPVLGAVLRALRRKLSLTER